MTRTIHYTIRASGHGYEGSIAVRPPRWWRRLAGWYDSLAWAAAGWLANRRGPR